MPATVTNKALNDGPVTSNRSSGETWDEATYTWEDANNTWDGTLSMTNKALNTGSLANRPQS